jgi:hypothetical protein
MAYGYVESQYLILLIIRPHFSDSYSYPVYLFSVLWGLGGVESLHIVLLLVRFLCNKPSVHFDVCNCHIKKETVLTPSE